MLISGLNLMNADKQCWYSCGGKQGKCSWCGSDGWCCRKNGNDPYWLPTAQSNGCDGTFGGSNQHQCALKPCSGLAAGKERIILKQVPILESLYDSDHFKALNFLCEIKFRQEIRALMWSELESASKIGTSFEIILPLITVVLI